MGFDLQELGITKEELRERVIERIAEQILSENGYDEDGNPCTEDSRYKQNIVKALKKRVDQGINELAEKYVLPNVATHLEGVCLQETTKWGEKVGKPLTFIEYLVARADFYLNEQVDYNGNGKKEGDSYNWSGKQTRVTYLVNSHLQYSIETAMKEALATANKSIAQGIYETVRLKINEVVAGIKATVKIETK